MFFKILFFPFFFLKKLYKIFFGFLRFIFFLNILVSIIGIIVLATFNLWFPGVIRRYVMNKSGFPLKVQESNCLLRKGKFEFKDINFQNPEGKFTQSDFLQINRLAIDVNWMSIFSQEFIIEDADIDIDKIVCEKNQNGDVNVLQFGASFVPSDKSLVVNQEKSNLIDKKITDKVEQRSNKKVFLGGSNDVSAKDAKRLRLVAVHDGLYFVVKNLRIHLKTCELHNITSSGERKVIDLDLIWKFQDVRSEKEVIRKIATDLQRYGISFVIQKVLGVIFDLPGVGAIKNSVKKVNQVRKDIMKTIIGGIGNVLPTKDSVSHALEGVKMDSAGEALRDAVQNNLLLIKTTDSASALGDS